MKEIFSEEDWNPGIKIPSSSNVHSIMGEIFIEMVGRTSERLKRYKFTKSNVAGSNRTLVEVIHHKPTANSTVHPLVDR